MYGFLDNEKGISTKAGIIIVIVVLVIGYSGYEAYTDNEAVKEMEEEISQFPYVSFNEDEVTIHLEMEFTNNSGYTSPPLTYEYEIFVGDGKVGEGETSVNRIESGMSQSEDLDFTVNMEDVEQAVWDSIMEGDFTVTLEGGATARILFGSIPVSETFEESYGFTVEI